MLVLVLTRTPCAGSGLTTTLVALIANAGPEDQAIATAVSYLFRSLGSVVGLSVGTTITQDVLRQSLRRRLTGEDSDVDAVCKPLSLTRPSYSTTGRSSSACASPWSTWSSCSPRSARRSCWRTKTACRPLSGSRSRLLRLLCSARCSSRRSPLRGRAFRGFGGFSVSI